MDIAGATKAAEKLIESENLLTDSAWFVAEKASWITQISGSYNLLFPWIHIDFPTRDEVMKYVSFKIDLAFVNHNSTHGHNGLYSQLNLQDKPDQYLNVMSEKTETMITKYGEKIFIRNDPSFKAKGYGV